MTVHGRHSGIISDSASLDFAANALPGVDPNGFAASNMAAWAAASDLAATATSVAIGTRIYLRRNDLITSVSFLSGATAAGTPTNWFHALYDPDGVLLAQSADQLTAAWAASTAKKLALSAPVRITRDGWYIAATSTTATTVQTLAGSAPIVATAAATATSKALGFTFGSALAGAAPATTGTQTTVAKCPLVILT